MVMWPHFHRSMIKGSSRQMGFDKLELLSYGGWR